jgi:hypothetical protein
MISMFPSQYCSLSLKKIKDFISVFFLDFCPEPKKKQNEIEYENKF